MRKGLALSSHQNTARRSHVAPPAVHEVLVEPGQPLDAETRTAMNARFDTDFSRVRAHTGKPAAESADAVSARA
jgi:hypothetical protein